MIITNSLSKSLYWNSINTLIMTLTVIVIYLFLRIFITRKTLLIKSRKKALARVFYMMAVIYVLFFSRIWIEGFSHIFAVLGIVAAALVITNKETIMNFTGWLVISWRGLFSEGDFIEVQNNKGYVHHIGILYFTLSSKKPNYKKTPSTDKVIRIPNGIIATNPLMNYSQSNSPHEETIQLILKVDDALEDTLTLLQTSLNAIVTSETNHYLTQHPPANSTEHQNVYLIKKGSRLCQSIKQDTPNGIEVVLKFYCFFATSEKIKSMFFSKIISEMLKNEKLQGMLYF